MAGGASGDEDEITGINVTPLVDVMLVLLIIFMVTANYIVNQSIQVNLPKADTAETTDTKTKNLAFVLDAKSQLFLDGQPISFQELGQRIADEKAKAGSQPVNALISADKDTPHGSVVKLIDTVKKAGITDFAINVEAGAGGP
jgi:biopolymer transport protein ExbD